MDGMATSGNSDLPIIQDTPSLCDRLDSELGQSTCVQLIAILRAHGIRRAGVFGSVARGNTHPGSDLDLLIDPPPTMGLFGLSALGIALEDLLQRPVDLVTYAALHPGLRPNVSRDYIELFDDAPTTKATSAA